MKHSYSLAVIPLLIITLLIPNISFAEDKNEDNTPRKFGRLESHEPNTVGFAYDSNDVNHMDFKVSLKYPIFHNGIAQEPKYGYLPYPYLAFTGRFSQYINTRESSPVISKRFNPELFFRYWFHFNADKSDSDYIDLAYGHESNGQSINTLVEYNQRRAAFIADGENPDFANDYISRGWDYLGFTWKFTRRNPFSSNSRFTSYVEMRYFLKDGLLQGNQEEYNSWENNPEGKPRNKVDGIRLKLKYKTRFVESDLLTSNKIFLSYTTGYSDIFKYSTYRAEWGVEILNLPLVIWVARGYNSDLADYYKKVTSAGINFEFFSN